MIYVFIVSAAGLAALVAIGEYTRREWRALPDDVVAKILTLPEKRPGQHVVDLVLDDGRVIERVYVAWGRFPTISPRRLIRHYDVKTVVDVRPAAPRKSKRGED